MTLPDKTNPSRPKKRSAEPRAKGIQPAVNGHRPTPRQTTEHVEPTDAPLYRRVEPDKKLQHHTLLWVGVIWMAMLTSLCVVAIAVGSVPIPLVAAIAIFAATTIPIIVRHVFPCGRR